MVRVRVCCPYTEEVRSFYKIEEVTFFSKKEILLVEGVSQSECQRTSSTSNTSNLTGIKPSVLSLA